MKSKAIGHFNEEHLALVIQIGNSVSSVYAASDNQQELMNTLLLPFL